MRKRLVWWRYEECESTRKRLFFEKGKIFLDVILSGSAIERIFGNE